MAIAKQVSDGSPDGASLGQSSTDKISFYAATPVSQQAALTSVATTVTATGFGFATSAAINNLIASVNSIITYLKNLGLTA